MLNVHEQPLVTSALFFSNLYTRYEIYNADASADEIIYARTVDVVVVVVAVVAAYMQSSVPWAQGILRSFWRVEKLQGCFRSGLPVPGVFLVDVTSLPKVSGTDIEVVPNLPQRTVPI